MTVPHDGDLPGRVAREAGLLAERLRRLSVGRLAAAFPPHASRAEAGHRVAQDLADAALGAERRHDADPPRWREVPRLGDHAVGDQVAVTGRALAAALAGVGPQEPVWTPRGRASTRAVADDLCARMRRLRLTA